MNRFWKKFGDEYDEDLVEEFRRGNEKHGKTVDYEMTEIKMKSYYIPLATALMAVSAVDLMKKLKGAGRPFPIPISQIRAIGGACGAISSWLFTEMASKVLFKDKGGIGRLQGQPSMNG
ncbi:hypothetical protein OROHE_016311 [Orobanche hederae]